MSRLRDLGLILLGSMTIIVVVLFLKGGTAGADTRFISPLAPSSRAMVSPLPVPMVETTTSPPPLDNSWRGFGGSPAALVTLTNMGRYRTWDPVNGDCWDDPLCIPTIRPQHVETETERDDLAADLTAHPGKTIFIFNEPNLYSQDGGYFATVQEVVDTYALIYDLVRGADPTATISCCGEGFCTHDVLDELLEEPEFQARLPDKLHVNCYPCSLELQVGQLCEDGSAHFPDRWNTELNIQRLESYHSWAESQLGDIPIIIAEIGILSTCEAEAIYGGLTCEEARAKVVEEVMKPLIIWYEYIGYSMYEGGALWFSSFYPTLDLGDLTSGSPDWYLTPAGVCWNSWDWDPFRHYIPMTLKDFGE